MGLGVADKYGTIITYGQILHALSVGENTTVSVVAIQSRFPPPPPPPPLRHGNEGLELERKRWLCLQFLGSNDKLGHRPIQCDV